MGAGGWVDGWGRGCGVVCGCLEGDDVCGYWMVLVVNRGVWVVVQGGVCVF